MCTIAVTGPRPHKLGNDYEYTSPLVLAIREDLRRILVNEGCTQVIAGMALGIDTVTALLALELNIPLVAAVPFRGQEKRWPRYAQELYHSILERAFDVVYVHEIDVSAGYDQQLIKRMLIERNKWMVDRLIEATDKKLIAVWDGGDGGTRSCYNYARKNLGEEYIIRINPNDYVSILSPQTKLF